MAESSDFNEELLKNITTGACLKISGILKASEGKEQSLELLVSEINILEGQMLMNIPCNQKNTV